MLYSRVYIKCGNSLRGFNTSSQLYTSYFLQVSIDLNCQADYSKCIINGIVLSTSTVMRLTLVEKKITVCYATR